MRNFLGVPNMLNVFANFPFLIVGVLGIVFCLHGSFFNIRKFNDLRLRMMFLLIPCIMIPFMTLLFPSKYTRLTFWVWAADRYIYLLSKFEEVADRKMYIANNYIISGHSLEHLCLAMFPTLLTFMLSYRSLRFQRLGDLKENH